MTISEAWQNLALLAILTMCAVLYLEIQKLDVAKIIEDVSIATKKLKDIDVSKINSSVDKVYDITNTVCDKNKGYIIEPFDILGKQVAGIKVC